MSAIAEHFLRLKTAHRVASRLLIATVAGMGVAHAAPVANPPVFSSDKTTHTLSVLIVAKPSSLSLPFNIKATDWVYEVCPRPSGSAPNFCPNGTGAQPYGGVRFALNAGDTLRIRLVNKLPPVADSKHCLEPGHSDLGNNPTNIHTHGLIVEPHRATGPNDTYGDYSFVEIRNPANHSPCPTEKAIPVSDDIFTAKICTAGSKLGTPGALHPDMDVVDTAAEYSIVIPKGHPSGLFWFHPHLHGIAMNQITSGLSGLISVGSAADACADAVCRGEVAAGQEQFLTLKDIQVSASGYVRDQQNAGLCNGRNDGDASPATAAASLPPQGSCFGFGLPFHWFHLVNGLNYPSLNVGAKGSIWRILNSAPSRFYDLYLLNAKTLAPITVQVISVDGVAIETTSGKSAAEALQGLASPVPCPGPSPSPSAVCVGHFKMLPSSRVELRVINPTTTPIQAVWETAEVNTGPSGDLWPAISLASVTLDAAAAATPKTISIGGPTILSAQSILGRPAEMQLPGTSTLVTPEAARDALAAPANHPVIQDSLQQTRDLAITPAVATGAVPAPSCGPLAPGHRRRIYFGYTNEVEAFGLGYVEVDASGKAVRGTARGITPYDATTPTVCVPLARGNKAVAETWELVNLTAEDHNFHIHQTKFQVLSIDGVPAKTDEAFIVHDNFPLPHANAACDGTLATAENPHKGCKTTTTVVQIYFLEIGDFVYHCHIMEHEDGGMMARIRVVPSPLK